MIMPSEFTYSGVIEAMERGEMYASMGPTFKEISFDGETIHVECSEVESIIAYFGGKRPKYIHALGEEKLTCADIEIDPNARYVRISAIDEKGRFADTRGYSLEELGITR